jgi:hypothetical protein
MAKYIIEECLDYSVWDDFVDNSPQGTVFSKSALVNISCEKPKFFLVNKGNERVGGFSLMLTEKDEPLEPVPYFHYFNSILFNNNDNILIHKKITEELRVSDLIISEVAKIYGKHYVVNTPYYEDMRAFQWFNYHEKDKGVYVNGLNYTAILQLGSKSEIDIINEIRPVRRQEYKKEGDFKIYETNDIKVFNELYFLTFERQNIQLSDFEINLFNEITKVSLEHGFGRLAICEYEGKPVSASLFLYDKKRSYYLFGANDPEYRNTGASTKLMIDNIMDTKKRGLNEVDFVGANSPNRGDYKIGFNAGIKPYYESSLNLNK